MTQFLSHRNDAYRLVFLMLTMPMHFFFVDAFVGRNDIYLVDLVGQHLLFCWRRWVLLMDIGTCVLVQYLQWHFEMFSKFDTSHVLQSKNMKNTKP